MGDVARASCHPLVSSWDHPDCHLILRQGAALTLPATLAQGETLENGVIGLEDVEATLKMGKERVLDDLQNDQHYSLITDTIKEMEWWACFQPQKRPSHPALSDIEVPLTLPGIQTLTKKSQRQPKDKRKRKMTKASRRKNRR